jgi:8-oxo-dGTP pyrophosphatase MutT (NUDIX family)
MQWVPGPLHTARQFALELHEQQTGGTKFPVKHTLRATDPETRQSGGQVDYFPPKRKGAPVHIDSLSPSLDTPGSGSAMMNEIQNRHPDSPIKFLHEVKRDQNTPSHTNSAHGEPTDWDVWHPGVEDDGIHRGFAARMSPEHASVINNPEASKEDHLHALHAAIPEGPKMGMHWTTDARRSQQFAHNGMMDPRTDIPVVLHAKGPARKDIETRPEHLFRNGVFPFDHSSKEREVPIRSGRKVEVTGISWKPDAEHPDADRNGWMHHTYDEGDSKHHTASRAQEEGSMEIPDAGRILRTAARDKDLGFHITASWRDVQAKAKRIRAEGGVHIVIASSDGIGGQVTGDHGVYEALLVYRPGTRKVGDWTCGCKWAAYSFDRSGPFQKFEGRKCSHALALQFEAQSQGMFGKEVHASEPPEKVQTIVRYDPDTGQNVLARPYEGSLVASLVAQMREADEDPAEVIGALLRVGMRHTAAVSLWKDASGHEEGSHASLPDLGMVDGNQLGPVLAAKEPTGPSVSGVLLKAHDTGRILMIQRGLDDEKDPARGTWEAPGGHHEDGDLTSLHAGIREFEEEVGQPFPEGGVVKHTWTSPNGIYAGHLVVIPSEKGISMRDGRVTPNPDDPKGDHHEQAAWWDVDHAKKNPALRPELKDAPWKEIAKASLDNTKTAAAWDPISNTNPQPGRGTSQPEHSNTTNPASTGWAAAEDPDNWNNLDASPNNLIPTLGFDGALHEQPEPALPVAYGENESGDHLPPYHPEITPDDLDPIPDNPPQSADLVPDQNSGISLLQGGSTTPNSYHASANPVDDLAAIVAAFQTTAAAQDLMTPAESEDDQDIAKAASAHLAKTALKDFDFAEQQEIINEGNDGRRARNLGDLQIQGTHYALIDEALARDGVDATGLFI